MLRLLLILAAGVWPTSKGDVEIPCPGPELFAAAEGRSLKLPAGCPALEAGLWRSIDGDAELYAEHQALLAERDQLRVELAQAQQSLQRCRQMAAVGLNDCARDLRLVREDLADVAPCECNEFLMGAAACAVCGVGAGVGTWLGGAR